MLIRLKASLAAFACTCLAYLTCSAPMATADPPANNVAAEFRTGKEGRPLLVEGSVRGKPIAFLVDTGASRTGFDVALRSLLGESLGRTPLNTVAGMTETENFNCPDISIGGMSLKSDRPVFCHNLQETQAAVGQELSGVLGMDILSRFVVQIDFELGILRLLIELPENPEDLGTAFPLSFQSATPQIHIRCGTVERPFVIDTGSTDTCIDSNTFNALAKAEELHVGPEYSVMTPLGLRLARVGLLEKLPLGPFIHRELLCNEASMCIVGLSYLSRYVVTLDFPNSVAYLRRGEQYTKSDLRGTSGLVVVRLAGRLIVKRVRPSGSAAMAGIRAGDEILAIKDEPSSKVDMFRARQLLTSAPGQSVILKLMRDSQIVEVSVIVKDRLAP